MKIEQRVARGVSWLAFFKFLSQITSWIVTVLVARILVPEDYGLLSMATIITGYAGIFGELGLGAAIIQRLILNEKELSSVFWFATSFSIILAVFAFLIARPTALIFDNVDVIPLTKSYWNNIFYKRIRNRTFQSSKKDLEFKKIGIIELISTITSCISMVVAAYSGLGVWTLVIGQIIRSFVRATMSYIFSLWKPLFHFNYTEAKSYIKFGLSVSFGNSFITFLVKPINL